MANFSHRHVCSVKGHYKHVYVKKALHYIACQVMKLVLFSRFVAGFLAAKCSFWRYLSFFGDALSRIFEILNLARIWGGVDDPPPPPMSFSGMAAERVGGSR